jgi:hypothetical protein
VRVQPVAPPALEGHFCIRGRRRRAHERGDEREKGHGLIQHPAAIALVEGIEHHAVPYVQPILEAEIHQAMAMTANVSDHAVRPPPFRQKPRPLPPEAGEEVLARLPVVVRVHR